MEVEGALVTTDVLLPGFQRVQELEKRAYYRSPWPRVVLTSRRKVEKYLEKQHRKGLLLEIKPEMFTFARKREVDGPDWGEGGEEGGQREPEGALEAVQEEDGSSGTGAVQRPGEQVAGGQATGVWAGLKGHTAIVEGAGETTGRGEGGQEPGQQGTEGAPRAVQGRCGFSGGGGSANPTSGNRDTYF